MQSLCADIDGFSPQAAVRFGADDRQATGQVCCYVNRLAVAKERVHPNTLVSR